MNVVDGTFTLEITVAEAYAIAHAIWDSLFESADSYIRRGVDAETFFGVKSSIVGCMKLLFELCDHGDFGALCIKRLRACFEEVKA